MSPCVRPLPLAFDAPWTLTSCFGGPPRCKHCGHEIHGFIRVMTPSKAPFSAQHQTTRRLESGINAAIRQPHLQVNARKGDWWLRCLALKTLGLVRLTQIHTESLPSPPFPSPHAI
jgi:hypothetical protein